MASDSFTGSNGTTLSAHDANWADVDATYLASDFYITDNTIGGDAWETAGAYYSTSSEDLSQIVFKGIVSGSVDDERHIAVRMGSAQFGYGAQLSGISGDTFTTVVLYRNRTTWISSAGSLSFDGTADHTIRITASGTSPVDVSVYVDDMVTPVLTYQDSTAPIASGSPGFYLTGPSNAAATVFDDWTDTASGASTPTITDVNADEIVELGSAGNVITGTNFEASQGTGNVRINTQSDGLGTDLAVTETAWSDTSITFTVPVGLPPGTAYIFVKNDSGQENATGFAITLTVPTGYESFTYDGTTLDPNTTESIQEDAAKAPTDGYGLTMAAGDIVIIETTGATWSVNGSYTQSSPANETAIYYVWDATASTMYGQSSPVTVTLAVKPTLSGATLTNTGSSNSLSWQFTTDFDVGDYHTYVSTSATPPSTTDHQNGTGAVYYTTAAVSAAGVISGTATGLNPSTTYYLHGLHVNNGVLSDQITSAGVATDSVSDNSDHGKILTSNLYGVLRNVIFTRG